MAIRHVLFDADGVLQQATRPWQPALQSLLRLADETQVAALVADVFRAETEVLECEHGFVERLQAVLAAWGHAGRLDDTLAVLHDIRVHGEMLETVQALRRNGLACHVASNQQALRARHMSVGLNYRSLFDSEFYSCFVGAAKPRREFFERVVARLGCEPGAVLFFDDRAENVAAARKAGLQAAVCLAEDGAGALRRQLADVGVLAP